MLCLTGGASHLAWHAVSATSSTSTTAHVSTSTDPRAVIVASTATLRRLGIYSGSWVVIANGGRTRQRIARLVHEEEEDSSTSSAASDVIVSASLLCSLGVRCNAAAAPVALQLHWYAPAGRGDDAAVCPAPHAAQATIAPLLGTVPAGANDPARSARALRAFFRTPRLLAAGDVFGVLVATRDDAGGAWEERERAAAADAAAAAAAADSDGGDAAGVDAEVIDADARGRRAAVAVQRAVDAVLAPKRLVVFEVRRVDAASTGDPGRSGSGGAEKPAATPEQINPRGPRSAWPAWVPEAPLSGGHVNRSDAPAPQSFVVEMGRTWLREESSAATTPSASSTSLRRGLVASWRSRLYCEAQRNEDSAHETRTTASQSAPLVNALRQIEIGGNGRRGAVPATKVVGEEGGNDDDESSSAQLRRIFAPAAAMPEHASAATASASSSASAAAAALAARSAALAGVCAFVLMGGARGGGKRAAVRDAAEQLDLVVIERRWRQLVGQGNAARAEEAVRSLFVDVVAQAPCVLHLRRVSSDQDGGAASAAPAAQRAVDVLRQSLRWLRERRSRGYPPVIVVASSDELDALSVSFRGCFDHELAIAAPDVDARATLLRPMLPAATRGDVEVEMLAQQSAGRSAAELRTIVATAFARSIVRAGAAAKTTAADEATATATAAAGALQLEWEDVAYALDHVKTSGAMALDAPKVPNVRWDDVGGLQHAKDEILDLVQVRASPSLSSFLSFLSFSPCPSSPSLPQIPLRHPELFARGVRQRSGLLLYGPPGTGKTLLAKAVATECALNFVSVKGPELLNMYVGESERNVRAVFEAARNAKPCVLFFDELDSLAPARGRGSDGGGVMDRVVSQLLTEIDGMSQNADVFVIAATNRPDLIDPALLRPGRFDKLIYLGVCEDKGAQLKILEALTRKFTLSDDVQLEEIGKACPVTFTGADFYALCSSALASAIHRRVTELEAELVRRQSAEDDGYGVVLTPAALLAELEATHGPDALRVAVSSADFAKAHESVTPSVSREEMANYEEIRRKFTS